MFRGSNNFANTNIIDIDHQIFLSSIAIIKWSVCNSMFSNINTSQNTPLHQYTFMDNWPNSRKIKDWQTKKIFVLQTFTSILGEWHVLKLYALVSIVM